MPDIALLLVEHAYHVIETHFNGTFVYSDFVAASKLTEYDSVMTLRKLLESGKIRKEPNTFGDQTIYHKSLNNAHEEGT